MKHRVMFVVFALLLALTFVRAGDKPKDAKLGDHADINRGTAEDVLKRPHGQQPAACCAPTELQSLKLQVAQRDAQLARVPVQAAFAEFQKAQQKLYDLAEQVKKENGWPSGTSFDGEKLAFTAPAKSPEPSGTARPAGEEAKQSAVSDQPKATEPAAAKPTEPQVPKPEESPK